MRFTQAQPPSVLGLVLIAAKELNQESGELFGSTPQALAWKQRAKNWVLANACIKRCGQTPAAFFTTECFQQYTMTGHGKRLYAPTLLAGSAAAINGAQ